MKKIKDIITIQDRISLFQTSMNNAGRNFQGKQVSIKKMADFAAGYYRLAIRQIDEMGKITLNQLSKIHAPKEETKKVVKRNDMKRLLETVAKRKR